MVEPAPSTAPGCVWQDGESTGQQQGSWLRPCSSADTCSTGGWWHATGSAGGLEQGSGPVPWTSASRGTKTSLAHPSSAASSQPRPSTPRRCRWGRAVLAAGLTLPGSRALSQAAGEKPQAQQRRAAGTAVRQPGDNKGDLSRGVKHGAAWGPRDEERGRTGRVATEPGCWWSQPSALCSAPARAPQGGEGAAGRRQEPSAHPPLSEPGAARPVPLLPARLLPSPRSPRPAAQGARGSGPA